ncbi:MAG: toll/interleukin-1 receptor domain-containing protein [Prolixibacteraceae bacterium]|nr:toll/interleukin-1 receptor domain-containing protein [Prolixibacteraceae bacterium]
MASIFEETKNRPKVFISYSYDSPEHEQWVLDLTNQLRSKAGIDAMNDKFALQKTSDLDEIMIKGFKDSDKVIIIATRNYAQKADNEKGGVDFEAKLATLLARNPEQKNKLIFVKRDKSADFKDVFPFQFKDYYAIDMSDDSMFEPKFKELFYKVWDKQYVEIEPVGNNPFEETTYTETVFEINNETVFNILEKSGFDPFGLNKTDFSNESIIIWPVVPRQQVNLIHYSQIEVIRVLSLLGWKTKIIIANCGQSDIVPSRNDLDFRDKLEQHLKKKSINDFSISFLNSYFSPDFEDGNKILANFVQISSALKISQLSSFNTKDGSYDDKAQLEINERTTLKYISPLFTWSASIYEATKYFENKTNSRAIIIAGRDEESQWAHVISEIDSHIGAIFIPILKQEDDRTIFQDKKPLLFSRKQLEGELGKGNMDKWLFQSFTNLAEFPKIVHSLPFCKQKNDSCTNSTDGFKCLECLFPENTCKFSDYVDKKKFIDTIYSKIEP